MKLVSAAFTLGMIVLMALASESALARGSHSGGGRAGGGHVGGGHFSGGHFSGGHFSGGHFSGHHFSGPRVHLGVFAGAPAFWYFPPAPYYYYPPLVAEPSPPPVYIEQGAAQYAPEQPAGNWYYCANAQAYYPYITECPGGWQPVAPQPQ